MKTSIARFLVTACLTLAFVPAWSAPVTVSSGLGATYVASGTSLTGNFDTNAAVAALGLSSPIDISSGTLTFRFSDDTDGSVVTSSSSASLTNLSYDFLGNPNFTGNRYYWLESTVVDANNPQETASVTVGGTTKSGSSPFFYQFFDGRPVQLFRTVCGFLGCNSVPVTTSVCTTGFFGSCTTYNVYEMTSHSNSGNTGDFVVTMALDALGIVDLLADGLLDFSIVPTTGDFNFLSASLTFDVTAGAVGPGLDPPVDPPIHDAPEPGTLPLAFVCMICLLTVRRRLSAPIKV